MPCSMARTTFNFALLTSVSVMHLFPDSPCIIPSSPVVVKLSSAPLYPHENDHLPKYCQTSRRASSQFRAFCDSPKHAPFSFARLRTLSTASWAFLSASARRRRGSASDDRLGFAHSSRSWRAPGSPTPCGFTISGTHALRCYSARACIRRSYKSFSGTRRSR
jgi:hypothetical protein